MTDPLDTKNRMDCDSRLITAVLIALLIAMALAAVSGAWAGFILGKIAACKP